MQTIGSIFLPTNRLLAWRNTLLHRLEPMSLSDPTKSGHFRMLFVYLVDPHYRISSTAIVPPQQHEWWADAVLDKLLFTGPTRAKIPLEIRDMIDKGTGKWPMGKDEAVRIKEEVDQERERKLKEVAKHMPDYGSNSEMWYVDEDEDTSHFKDP
jgi:hypothetical protein